MLWYGIAAPAGTPKPIVEKLNAALAKSPELPDIREGFAKQGAEAARGTPKQYDAFIRQEAARWREVVKQAGIKAE
jgi:tripartite-type tricarboxylate transporter receptor subunit TctC